MNDRPTADELLAAVRDYLLTEVAPAAPDHRARFRALISANVLAIVRRELAESTAGMTGQAELDAIAALLGDPPPAELGGPTEAGPPTLADANRRLAAHIRAGAADADADADEHAVAVRRLVRAQVEGKLAVNNPAFLQRFAGQ